MMTTPHRQNKPISDSVKSPSNNVDTRPNHIDDDELACLLALHFTPGIGVNRIAKILSEVGNAKDGINALLQRSLPSLKLGDRSITALKHIDWNKITRHLEWASQNNHHIITFWQHEYPHRLRQIDAPPTLLFVKGDPQILKLSQIAVVGSRNASHSGKETAHHFAKQLSLCGLVITSGMALGIDASSHQGALLGNGVSIAVQGTGLDIVYPSQHRQLAHEIAQQGALVSEFPLGSAPKPKNFPRRNRIISGLSLGILIVEAATKSGSLSTARFALEQGRDVFAIPGSTHSPYKRGCHQLIRDGAKLVENIQHILEEIAPQLHPVTDHSSQSTNNVPPKSHQIPLHSNADLSEMEAKILSYLDDDENSIDLIVQRSGLTAETISSMLVSLELKGLTKCNYGRYSRVKLNRKYDETDSI